MDIHASPVRAFIALLVGSAVFAATAAAGGDGGASGGNYLTQTEADALYAPIGGGPGGDACTGYPVGSVYLSILPTNPGTLLGCGTWTQIAQGRALVGQDPGDTQFDVAEETSGAKTVAAAGTVSAPTITVDALSGGTRKGGTSNPGSIIENGNVPTASASAPTFTGSATSVVQPSFVIYVFKRTL